MESKTVSTILITTFSIPLSSITTPNKVRRQHTLIRALRITILVILILVGIAGAAPFAYVTSIGIGTGTVFVIDTATNTVDAVVDVGIYPRKIEVNPKGSRVYVTNRYSRVADVWPACMEDGGSGRSNAKT